MNGKIIGLLAVLAAALVAIGGGIAGAQLSGNADSQVLRVRLDGARAVYVQDTEGAFASYVIGAPEFVNAAFAARWIAPEQMAAAPPPTPSPTPTVEVSDNLHFKEDTTLTGRRDQDLAIYFGSVEGTGNFRYISIECEGSDLDMTLVHGRWLDLVWSNGWNTGVFRVDGGQATNFAWKRWETSGRYSDFSTRQHRWFLNQLRGGSTLRMSLYESGEVVGTADITGIEQYLDRMVCLD